MKRPLFVFAGQSNMMGAPVYDAKEQIYFENSFEYLHKPKRFGAEVGEFKKTGFPAGEFSYKDLKLAYGENASLEAKSSLNHYFENTYFCPSLCNLISDSEKTTSSFDIFSEADYNFAPSMAPFIIKGLEGKGIKSAYTHIAKGRVSISHYIEGSSSDYFNEKVTDFFNDCEIRFPKDELSDKILVWHQGEADAKNGYDFYMKGLSSLWEKAKGLGFNKFLIVRIGYFGDEKIDEIMRAQEDFCRETEGAFIITRVVSFMKYFGHSDEGWIIPDNNDEFLYCRDSFYGFRNQHINEKGFKVIAKYAVPNIMRVLYNEEPILEEERIIPLMEQGESYERKA